MRSTSETRLCIFIAIVHTLTAQLLEHVQYISRKMLQINRTRAQVMVYENGRFQCTTHLFLSSKKKNHC